MVMTLSEIADMQKQLDQHILDKHQLKQSDTFRKRVLAFLVELGELANETRCFKYWSVRPSSEKDIVLDEYVDGIHFLVSLGNDLGIDFRDISFMNGSHTENLSEVFLAIFDLASQFANESTKQHFMSFFEGYVSLCYALGFSYEDVVSGYIQKNKVNHERQESNY